MTESNAAYSTDSDVKCENVKIKIENVNAWYGKEQALRNINIEIMKNRITAFIGPSGCGKTTLLRCFNRMNDIIKSFSMTGLITIDGEDIYKLKRQSDLINLRKRVGMVFQQPNLFPRSVYSNMKLPIKENLNGVSSKKTKEIIIDKLNSAHIYEEVRDRLNKSALRLSGGQQQRICIARALTIEPDIILFDEPCSALDPVSTMKIEDLLLDLKESYTIIIVTHNLEQARRIADSVVFFYQGEIIEQGANLDIFINPKEKLTQNYIRGKF